MLTRRALVVSIVLAFLTVLWVRQVELIKMTCQITESVPPIPALMALSIGSLVISVWRGALEWICSRRAWVVMAGLLLIGAGSAFYTHVAGWGQAVGTLVGLPGLLLLCTGLFARWLLSAHERLVLTRSELIGIYIFLSVASVMSSVGGLRLLLPCITALRYFATAENRFEEFQPHQPHWFGPQDEEAIRQFYEGVNYDPPSPEMGSIPIVSDVAGGFASVLRTHNLVPWRTWAPSLSVWLVFLVVFFVTTLCLVSLLRRQWTDSERLGYPLVEFAMDMARPSESVYSAKSFFRNRLMWCGFGAATFYNIVNLLNAVNPSIPALGKTFSLGQFFTEHPWTALAGLSIHYRPALLGLGFLVSLEILLSVWVFHALILFETVFFLTIGLNTAGQPFPNEQGAGAYLILGLYLAWAVARQAWQSLRVARDGRRPRAERLALAGAVGGFLFLVGFSVYAGMALWMAATYMALLLLFAIVYARIRAETGAPLVWLFPYYQQEKMILNVAGLKGIAPGGNYQSATVLSGMMFMARGYYPTLMGTQVEAMRLAGFWRGTGRQMIVLLVIAAVVGLVFGGWMHLTTYYQYGGNVLEGGSTQGGYRTDLAHTEYTNLTTAALDPPGTNKAYTEAHAGGAAFALLLITARKVFLRFPLHPLGFAMATSFGQVMWFSFFLVWLIKSVVLRIGGIRLYRTLVPFFLGLALGHFFAAGVCLGVAGLWGGDLLAEYKVWFG